MNFGVLEIAPSKYVPAPGYAYVPDVSNAPQIGLQPSARRARGPAGAGLGAETTKKQDAKILRELAQLDRENHRDVNIPVTGGGRGKEGGEPQKKRSQRARHFHTPTNHEHEHTDDQLRSGNSSCSEFHTCDIHASRIHIRAVFVRVAAPETAPQRSRSVACFARAESAECAGDAEVVGGAAVELCGGERGLDGGGSQETGESVL
ncbi:uncharacterized protein EAF02_009308 [Botrytis sinoallii]|uniref:uncharacterized protein n=1 Tax=Botrytis sinoallii TaxID=1463999 RepID=UPI001900685E|nr:uncharacterized protein EAF02_009308 [Botrytis sinoallii]KAF7870118.1 hypothetical protein EAF02_009308 [Botrytis sinoallii]